LPTYYQGYWLWLSRKSWNSLFYREEPHVARALKSYLRPGDRFWDIGANIGWFSLLGSKIVGSTGKVFSFEPSPDVFSLLAANTQGLKRVRITHCGVGNEDTVAVFASQGTSSSASFVEAVTKFNQHHLPGTPIRKVEVNIRKVDTLAGELGPPHLAKIDVEGFEFEVLRGATGVLSSAKPTLIVEIHPPQLSMSGGSEASLFQFLKEHDYVWEIIDRNPNSLYTIIASPISGRENNV
jgi:FkbM family methyltransferase